MEAYITHLHTIYDKHRVLHRVTKLEDQTLETNDRAKLQSLYSKFNALDLERIWYMKRAETLCKYRITFTYEWPPTLAKMGGRISYWKLRRQMAKALQGGQHHVERQKQLGIQDSGSQELDYINDKLRLTWSELHSTQKNAGQLRKTHLEELAAFKGEAEHTTAAKERKKLLHIEQVRKTAMKHGWYLKEKRKDTLDHIRSPTPHIIDAMTLMVCLLVPIVFLQECMRHILGAHSITYTLLGSKP